jgi:hypothetical protein
MAIQIYGRNVSVVVTDHVSLSRRMSNVPDYQDPFVDIFRPLAQCMHATISVKGLGLPRVKIRRIVFVEALHGTQSLSAKSPNVSTRRGRAVGVRGSVSTLRRSVPDLFQFSCQHAASWSRRHEDG